MMMELLAMNVRLKKNFLIFSFLIFKKKINKVIAENTKMDYIAPNVLMITHYHMTEKNVLNMIIVEN